MLPIRSKDLYKNRDLMIKNLNHRINNKFLRIRKVSNFLQNIAALERQPVAKTMKRRLRFLLLIKIRVANSHQYY
jgi:predicted metallo-beta-lactamase superfamily hydrolase